MISSPCLFLAAFLAEISWGGIGERLLSTGIVAGVTAMVMLGVLKYQTRDLARAIVELTRTLKQHERDIADIRNERTQCELRSVKTMATREEFAQTLVEVSANHREQMTRLDAIADSFRSSVAKAHGRVDALTERTTRVEERTSGKLKGPRT